MAGYLGNIPTPQATQTRDTFTATASQTSFATSGYTVGMLDVYLNGIKLASADFTATNGSDVVLASGASADDIVEVVSFSTFDSASGAFSVDVQSDKIKTATIAHTNNTTGITIGTDGVISQPTLPIFHVTKSADQTGIADAAHVQVTFDEITDGSNGGRTINQGGLWASNKLTVTASTAGYYWVYTNLFWQTSGSAIGGNNYGYWKKNGSTNLDEFYTNTQGNTDTTGVLWVNQVVDLTTSGDYLELYIYFDNQGGSTTTLNQNSVTAARTTAGGYKIA